MRRRHHIQGTRRYLYWGLLFLAVGVVFAWDGWIVAWLDPIWDGWLPRRSVLAKHPSPGDSFYLFNQVVGALSLTAAAVCGYIHHVVK